MKKGNINTNLRKQSVYGTISSSPSNITIGSSNGGIQQQYVLSNSNTALTGTLSSGICQNQTSVMNVGNIEIDGNNGIIRIKNHDNDGVPSKDSIISTFLFRDENVKYTETFIRAAIFEPMIDINWESLCRSQNLSERFLVEFSDRLDWRCVSRYQHLSPKFMLKYHDHIDWELASEYQEFGTKDITLLNKFIDFKKISLNPKAHISDRTIQKYGDLMDWKFLSGRSDIVNNAFVSKYGNKPGFDLRLASWCCDLTEATILKYLDRIDFHSPRLLDRDFRSPDIRCYIALTNATRM
jgi:hypothetical protein